MNPVPLASAGLDTGDTAWLLAATALVLLMTPGLALFYGGMVRTKSVLNMLMMSFVSIALVTVVWLVAGYSLAFGDDVFAGLIGGIGQVGMAYIGPDDLTGSVPTLLFTTFQLTFAILTAALISGAVADRMKFAAWLVFVPVWTLLVYVPVAHWVWGPGGWIADSLGALDFMRRTRRRDRVRGVRSRSRPGDRPPHRLQEGRDAAAQPADGDARCRPALVRLARLQRGSALGANGMAAASVLNTLVAGCTGLLGWLFVEQRRDGHPTTFGAASGVVAGLVAITPACGTVGVLGAAVVGLVAGVVCSYAVAWKFRYDYDDSLDVVGVHFVGGVIGTLLVGLFATAAMTGGTEGLFYGGGAGQLARQAVAVLAVAGYTFLVTYGIGRAIDAVMGVRASEDDELTGLDQAVHAESAYDHGGPGHAASLAPGHSVPLSRNRSTAP